MIRLLQDGDRVAGAFGYTRERGRFQRYRAKAVALAPFERTGEGPYQLQYDLRDLMQALVGIVQREDEMLRALDGTAQLSERAAKVGVQGDREFNPGWPPTSLTRRRGGP